MNLQCTVASVLVDPWDPGRYENGDYDEMRPSLESPWKGLLQASKGSTVSFLGDGTDEDQKKACYS